jgi:hypothetical protein
MQIINTLIKKATGRISIDFDNNNIPYSYITSNPIEIEYDYADQTKDKKVQYIQVQFVINENEQISMMLYTKENSDKWYYNGPKCLFGNGNLMVDDNNFITRWLKLLNGETVNSLKRMNIHAFKSNSFETDLINGTGEEKIRLLK